MLEKVFIVSRIDKKEALEVLKTVIKILEKKRSNFLVESNAAEKICISHVGVPISKLPEIKPTLIIVIGGDGTILRLHSQVKGDLPPILPVRVATFGFLSELEPVNVEQAIRSLEEGKFYLERRQKLKVDVKGKETDIVNELAILSETGKAAHLKIMVNGSVLVKGSMDGCLVATPTGTLAYNLSTGGPVADPELSLMTITLINPWPFSLSIPIKFFIIPLTKIIKAINEGSREISLFVDGIQQDKIGPGEALVVSKAESEITFVRLSKNFFYERLQNWEKKKQRRYTF